MSAVSIYCPDGEKGGKTFAALPGSEKPFFVFRMTSSGGGSDTYDNSNKLQLGGIVTSLYIEKEEGVSISSTVGTDIFLYVGGETPWNIRVSGFAFNNCDSDVKGFDRVLEWYSKENVSETGGCCELSIGSQVFKGYLIRCQIGSVTEEALNLFKFNFTFVAIKR